MRKIVVHMTVSVDGFFEGSDHDLSWHLVDDELHAHEQLSAMSTFIEGRVTYELMEAVRPTADQNPDLPAAGRTGLELLETHRFGNGVGMLRYGVAGR
ncbi:dihydrofolate reductase family protein [Blastococcus sp. SYSU DS0552]